MTGGYLILERPNTGLVLSTNARFYAIVKPINEEVKPESWAWVSTSSQTHSSSSSSHSCKADKNVLALFSYFFYRNGQMSN